MVVLKNRWSGALLTAIAAVTVLLTAEFSVAQPSVDFSVVGAAGTQRIVAVPRQGHGPAILSLKGTFTWTNSQGSSPGIFKYRWGVLDESGNFIALASETSRLEMKRPDSENTDFNVERSILVASNIRSSSSSEDILAAIRIEECMSDPPNPNYESRCAFSGTISVQQMR